MEDNSDLQTQIQKNTEETINKIPRQKQTKLTIIITSVLIILLGIFIILIYLYKGNIKSNLQLKLTDVQSSKQTKTNQKQADNTIQSKDVEWLPKPEKVQDVGFFNLIDQYYPYRIEYCKGDNDTDIFACNKLGEINDKYEGKVTYYKVGTMKSQYNGSPVYIGIVRGLPQAHVFKSVVTEKDITYDGEMLSIFIKTKDGKFIVTKDYSNLGILCRGGCKANQEPQGNDSAGIIYNPNLSLDPIGSKTEYVEPSTGIKFYFTMSKNRYNLFEESGLYLLKDLGDGYVLYSNQDINSTQIKFKTVIDPAFVMKLPTGLAIDLGLSGSNFIYQKGENDSGEYQSQPHLIWEAEDKPQLLPKEPSDKGLTDYTGISYTTDFDGCRGNIYLESISHNSEILDTNDLIRVATTDQGDIAYDIKNKSFKVFEAFWLSRSIPNGPGINLNYNDYINLKPILILKNKLGIYRTIFRSDLVSSKCWAEPLMYLYPERETNVQIKLGESIKLSESEPALNNSSWNVLAYPSGKIYDSKSKKYFPYLYWEGSAPINIVPVSVDVVGKEETHNYLEQQLTKLGLNDKERRDFENYWEPKLKESPYYKISFYETDEINKVAPLIIKPKPDTLIRVLMSYEELDNKIEVDFKEKANYQSPTRRGFTIVEWGGIINNYSDKFAN